MQIGDWAATRSLNGLYLELRKLGLETHVAELEAFGFTVVENALPQDLLKRAKAALFTAIESRYERPVDQQTGEGHAGVHAVENLLFQDRVFEEILMQPGPLALVTYLLGESCLLSNLATHAKGPGGAALNLHADVQGNGTPAPFPFFAQVANLNYALTDYDGPGSGAFGIVPGSHRYCRPPNTLESSIEDNRDAVSVDCPAGSAILFHGNAWHGSYIRRTPGWRLNLSVYFHRRYMDPQLRYRELVPADALARNDDRFAVLMGRDMAYGVRDDGVDHEKLMAGFKASRSLHA
jgi:ectoine hydroxylase-related dioxygenase (phytanoyl-CoA dioxygenase family)